MHLIEDACDDDDGVRRAVLPPYAVSEERGDVAVVEDGSRSEMGNVHSVECANCKPRTLSESDVLDVDTLRRRSDVLTPRPCQSKLIRDAFPVCVPYGITVLYGEEKVARLLNVDGGTAIIVLGGVRTRVHVDKLSFKSTGWKREEHDHLKLFTRRDSYLWRNKDNSVWMLSKRHPNTLLSYESSEWERLYYENCRKIGKRRGTVK